MKIYKPKLISYYTYKFLDLLKLYVYERKLPFLRCYTNNAKN